jgi:hypothetical protein
VWGALPSTDVDYDPSGQIIAESFRDRLTSLALAEVQKLTAPPGDEHQARPPIKGFPYPV